MPQWYQEPKGDAMPDLSLSKNHDAFELDPLTDAIEFAEKI